MYNKNSQIMYISSKLNKKDDTQQKLTVQITYMRYTKLNPLPVNIVFVIIITNEVPETLPIVKCLTNFSFPTCFDNRNLLYSIINHHWVSNSNIEEIIEKIPSFITRVMENNHNKILVYYGDYIIDKIYNINEFLANSDLSFFKIHQFVRKGKDKIKKDRYIILTDIYFLLFDPVPDMKNLAKLLFWGDIRQIISCKGSSSNTESILLEWKNDNRMVINFEILFLSSSIKEFVESSNKKIAKLRENYKIFQDDMNKPEEDGLKDMNQNIDKLILLIKYKENLLEKKHSINLIKELMSLYQKVIEVLSARNDMGFKEYLDKLHVMLTNKEIQDDLERDKNESQISKIFELSNSYEVQNDEEYEENENDVMRDDEEEEEERSLEEDNNL